MTAVQQQVIAGRFLTVPPVLTDGMAWAPLLDSGGRLVTVTGGATPGASVLIDGAPLVTYPATAPIEAAARYGWHPGALTWQPQTVVLSLGQVLGVADWPQGAADVAAYAYGLHWGTLDYEPLLTTSYDPTFAPMDVFQWGWPSGGVQSCQSFLIAGDGIDSYPVLLDPTSGGLLALPLAYTEAGAIVAQLVTPAGMLRSVEGVPAEADTIGPSRDSAFVILTGVSKFAPAWLLSLILCNNNAAGAYFQIHNKLAVPALGDVPILSIWMPPGAALLPPTVIEKSALGGSGFRLAIGLAWGWSSTPGTFTIAASATGKTSTIGFV